MAGTAASFRSARPVLCGSCRGRTMTPAGEPACAVCGGAGYVRPPAAPEAGEELPADLAAGVGAFLAAWSAIEKYGVDGWMRLDAAAAEFGPHPELLEHLAMFDRELDRLEHGDAVRDAEESRRARR